MSLINISRGEGDLLAVVFNAYFFIKLMMLLIAAVAARIMTEKDI